MEKLDLRLASNPDWWERNENYAKVLKPNDTQRGTKIVTNIFRTMQVL